MPRDVHPTPFIIHPSDEFTKNIDLRNLSHSLATKYANGHVVTDDDLQIMGRMLWTALVVQDDFRPIRCHQQAGSASRIADDINQVVSGEICRHGGTAVRA